MISRGIHFTGAHHYLLSVMWYSWIWLLNRMFPFQAPQVFHDFYIHQQNFSLFLHLLVSGDTPVGLTFPIFPSSSLDKVLHRPSPGEDKSFVSSWKESCDSCSYARLSFPCPGNLPAASPCAVKGSAAQSPHFPVSGSLSPARNHSASVPSVKLPALKSSGPHP